MRLHSSFVLLLTLPGCLCQRVDSPLHAAVLPNTINTNEEGLDINRRDDDGRRNLQATSCLAATGFIATSFTAASCTPALIRDAVSTAMADNGCAGSVLSELAALLELPEELTTIDSALASRCDAAFSEATLDFRKVTKRGDAFDREFFHGGSDWNDQYEVTADGVLHHVLT